MHPTHLIATVLLALLGVDASVGADCDHPTPVLAFEAASTASLIVTLPPDAANSTSGHAAGTDGYDVVLEILSEKKVCVADRIAFTAGKALNLYKTLTTIKYFSLVGFNVGPFMYSKGLLTCENAVSLALDFSGWVRKGFEGKDLTKFKSLEYGIVYGIVQFLLEHGFSLETDLSVLANDFYVELSNETKDSTCPAPR